MSTTSTDIFRRAGIDAERDEQARQAVLEGRKFLPTLNSYVRAISGRKDLIVEMATRDNGSTSGTRIYWRPPMALGDKTPHNRLQCNKRGPDMQLLCAACAKREDVLVVIYHEIAHNIFGSFQEVGDKDKLDLIEQAIETTGGRWAKQIRARIEAAPDWTKKSYISMCGLINEYLPMIFNALEDARVNREMFKARKGLKGMFDAQVTKTFTEGVEQLDALGKMTKIRWEDYPLNAQAIVGLFAKASGFDYSGWFQPSVVAALDDADLTNLLNRLGTVRSAAGVYHLGFPVLARLRELGFCALPDDPDPDPDPQPEGESEDDPSDDTSDESSDDSSGDDSSEESGSPDGGAGGSEEPDPAGSEDSSGTDTEDSEDEAGNPGGSGGDPDESTGEPGADGDPGDGEVPEDSSSDEDLDESSGAPGMGSDDSPEDLGEGSSGAESEHGDSDSDVQDGSSGGDSDGGEDSDVPQQTAESNRGTGEITDPNEGGEPEQEPVDGEANAGGGSDSEGDDDPSDRGTGTVNEPADPERSGDDQPTDAADDSSESSPADADGSGEDSDGSSGEEVDDTEDPAGGTGSTGDTDSSTGHDPAEGVDGDGSHQDGLPSGDTTLDRREPEPADPGSPEDDSQSGEQPSSGEADDQSRPDGTDDEGEPIDTGADRGLGGTEVVENPDNEDKPLPEQGTPEDARTALLKLGDHEEPPKRLYEDDLNDDAIDRAIIQGIYFETPSRNIFGVREHKYGVPYMVDGTDMNLAWQHDSYLYSGLSAGQLGIEGDFDPAESLLGGALVRMRVAFSDNARGKNQQDLKGGKVNPRVLGKRAWNGDERLFRKRTMPGKKSYFVLIGMDISGSTIGRNIALEKRAVMAQAELCHRMGIKFAIFAHSGNYHKPRGSRAEGIDLDIYIIKEHNQPWNDEVKTALRDIGPDNCNLDGHTLEYYRKYIERRPETDKIILYYTDGKMPAENHDEELIILQREIKTCKRRNITLLGVGIRTNSPVRHGLDTVQVDEDEDIVKVVRHLEKRLRALSGAG